MSERILSLGSKFRVFTSEISEHQRQFGKSELIDLVRGAGYKIECFETFEFGLNYFLVIRSAEP